MLLERALEKRATVLIANPRDPVLANWWGLSGMTEAGISVTPETALQLTAVFACVRVLTESIASLPLHVYRTLDGGGKEKATNHPLYKLFQYGPNNEQTAFDWLEMQVGHMVLRGNAYNQLLYPAAGPLAGIKPLHPDFVKPFRDKQGRIWYAYEANAGEKKVFSDQEILHFSIFSDGLKGRSVIEYNREAVGLGLAAEQFGSRFFQNGATMSGVLELAPGSKLSDQARENLKKSLADRHQGSRNANRFMLLEEGLKWTQLGVPPDQAQFLETRKMQVNEIARMFRVPPHMIGDLERSTNNNIEHQGQEFGTFTLLPLTTRMERRMEKDLLTDTGKKSFSIGFDMNALLRADSAARSALYTVMFQTGAYSPNDIRSHEGDNPVADGDKHYVPMNMVEVGAPPPEPKAPAEPTDPQKNAARTYQGLFRSAWDRIVTAEVRGLRRALDGGDIVAFGKAANELLHELKPLMRKHLTPVIDSLRTAIDTENLLETSPYVEKVITQHISELAEELSEAGTPENLRKLIEDLDLNGITDIIERETQRAVLWACGGIQ
jgi:HK97 family phage portal protein